MLTRKSPCCLALLLLALAMGPVLAEDAVERDTGLGVGYSEHVPSAWEMRQGRQDYEAGNYMGAFWHYTNAAVWADKFAQYNIGVMYLRGEGVEFDPVRGWAWLELAAERGYPEMVLAANDLYRMLDEAQQREGRRILEEELLPDYGDAVRIKPTARRMERERRQATGTRTGSKAALSALRIIDGSGITRRGDEFYDPAKWDFERIVRFETQFMRDIANAGATLGEFRIIEDEDESGSDEEPEDGTRR